MRTVALQGLQQTPSVEALAYAADRYGISTGYDSSYRELLHVTGGSVDLNQPAHRSHLLSWLNSCGCRQFKVSDHPLASQELASWYKECRHLLPALTQDLFTCADKDLERIGEAYDRLRLRTASKRVARGRSSEVTFGPTGASKVLFALRPQVAIPWDKPERDSLGYGESGNGYISYLKTAQRILRSAQKDCGTYNIQIADIPRLIGRPETTPAKMVDEYLWIVVTKKMPLPNEQDLKRWFTERTGHQRARRGCLGALFSL